jgi:hypothetical protein
MMTMFDSLAEPAINLLKFSPTNVSIFALAILASLNTFSSSTLIKAIAQANQTIEGQSGGSTDSQGCGFISDRPNYEMNLEQRVDYMRFTVQTDGGQPTLLVLGPNPNDSFCILGDEVSGLKPEISGVWEAGSYQIYVGDRQGDRHKFTLDISTNDRS